MILYIKNIDIEGPDTLGVFFKERGFESKTIDLPGGETLPEKLDDIDAVVVFGGPMNVYEQDAFPFLKVETKFIQRILDLKIPFLGLCLGS